MLLFITTMLTVFLLAFQQQNVISGYYKLAALTSAAISLTQFYMFRYAAFGEWYEWVYMAIGGSIGVTASMYLHRKYLNKQQ